MPIDEHRRRMNRVLEHIESHLDDKLSVEELSGIACYSPYHFHRLFRAYAGEAIYAYRKRLLLERAAKQLVYSDEGITDIAFTAGYDNQASFNKAFRKQFSVSPGEFRKQKLRVNSRPIPDIKESIAMKPQIKTIDTLNLLGVRKQGVYSEASPEAWGELMGYAYSHQLMNKDTQLIGITYDNPDVTEPGRIRYDACITVGPDAKPEGEVQKKTIAKGTYAVFLHKGPYSELNQAYDNIFNAWLQESDYRLREEPCFEIYLNRDPRRTKPENLKTEIYVPVEQAA